MKFILTHLMNKTSYSLSSFVRTMKWIGFTGAKTIVLTAISMFISCRFVPVLPSALIILLCICSVAGYSCENPEDCEWHDFVCCFIGLLIGCITALAVLGTLVII